MDYYSDYREAKSKCLYGGPKRDTPFILQLFGFKPFREWRVKGDDMWGGDPERCRGYWEYED